VKYPRAIVTGGRGFADRPRIWDDLAALREVGLHRVAEGQSPGGGADDHAHAAWREVAGEPTQRYPIDSRIDGNTRGAPLARNARMVKAEHHLAVDAGELLIGLAYPDPKSRGTWHCIAEMLKRGIPVVVWAPHALLMRWPFRQRTQLWEVVRNGVYNYAASLNDPLVFDWGTPRGVIAPVGADEAEFAALALQVREALGELP
jgi:hypothetical protein